jgi:hypothetical protein
MQDLGLPQMSVDASACPCSLNRRNPNIGGSHDWSIGSYRPGPRHGWVAPGEACARVKTLGNQIRFRENDTI